MTRTAATPQGVPIIIADPFSPENLMQPHALHQQLREAGPVVYLERYSLWAMARYEQVNAALKNWAPLLVRSLLSAGIDTTVNGLAAAIYAFASHPDQWSILRSDPSLAKLAFEEIIRWESPVQTFFRTTTREVEVAGTHIPAGEKVLLFLGAANRDPRRCTDPDRFDIRRNASGHVGFGMGIHRCVGQTVARLEGEIMLTALANRVERIEFTGQPQRKPNNTLLAWSSLPIAIYTASA